MPRIAAALGVFATLAFCVGFNIARYPVVWTMVAAPPPTRGEPAAPKAVPAAGTARSGTTLGADLAKPVAIVSAESESRNSPIPAIPPMATRMESAPCDSTTGVCSLASARLNPPPPADEKVKAKDASPRPIGWPAESGGKKPSCTKEGKAVEAAAPKRPSGPKHSSAATAEAPAQPPDQIGLPEGAKDLVPVVRSKKTAAKTPAKAAPSPSKPVEVARAEPSRRAVERLPAVEDHAVPPPEASFSSDSSVPLYPSTGVQ